MGDINIGGSQLCTQPSKTNKATPNRDGFANKY
jgi:hypothetical protein